MCGGIGTEQYRCHDPVAVAAASAAGPLLHVARDQQQQQQGQQQQGQQQQGQQQQGQQQHRHNQRYLDDT